MIRAFFLTSLRGLIKDRSFSLINLVGLTCGLCVVLLVISYARFELSFEDFNPDADRIFRLTNTTSFGRSYAQTPPALAEPIKAFFPSILEAARMYERSVSIQRPGHSDAFEEDKVFFTDSSLFKIMRVKHVQGQPDKLLAEKFTAVINEEMATKYFSNEDPIGATLILSGRHSFKVIAVVKDFPKNSHLHFNILLPFDNMYDLETAENAAAAKRNLSANFVTTHSYTYLLLKDASDAAALDMGMSDFLKKHVPAEKLIGQTFSLMRLKDIRLHSTLSGEQGSTNTFTSVSIFCAIAVLTLLMSGINYANMSAARALSRLQEMGMRKILGASKRHLIVHFYLENFIFCFATIALSIVGFYFLLPLLGELTGSALSFTEAFDLAVALWTALVLITFTLLAGAYPAYFIGQFNTVNAIKGAGAGHSGRLWLRRSLVTAQITIAMVLITGSVVVLQQLSFLLEKPLGFRKQLILTIPLFNDNLNLMYGKVDSTFHSRIEAYREMLRQDSRVLNTTVTSDVPGVGGVVYRYMVPEGRAEDQPIALASISTDYDFVETMGLDVVSGRAFNRKFVSDVSNAFIINETAVKDLQFENPDQAVGKSMLRTYDGKRGTIVGVVKDFHLDVLTAPLSPLVMDINPDQYSLLALRLNGTETQDAIDKCEAAWKQLFPEKTFQYSFLDEQIRKEYTSIAEFGRTVQYFTAVAVVIACLGVYGLVLFVVQRKQKEIAVRKILGASMLHISKHLSTEFISINALSLIVAFPASYYLGTQWLNTFAFRIDIDWWPFLASFGLILVVTAATIGYQIIKAARINPAVVLPAK